MKFIVLAITLSMLAVPAMATKKKLNLKPQADKKVEDPSSAEHLLYESPQKVEKNSTSTNPKLKAKTSCTDTLGMVHNSGDKGFDSCMRNLDKTLPGTSDPRRSSVGITIGN